MRWRSIWIAQAWALLAVAACLGQPHAPSNYDVPGAGGRTDLKPWVSRQTTFNIPFTVDLSSGTPTEVQLFVSHDAGRTWQFHGRQSPTAKSFPFRATADGSYWFSSRTIDPKRNVPRVDSMLPELYVIVDTQQPRLEFTAVAGRVGEVTTVWKAVDATLEPSSMKIEYETTANNSWRPVAIDPTRQRVSPGALVGEMTWYPAEAGGNLSIRAEVADAAGNKAFVTRQVTLPAIARPESSSVPQDPYVKATPTMPDPVRWPRDNVLRDQQPVETHPVSTHANPTANPSDGAVRDAPQNREQTAGVTPTANTSSDQQDTSQGADARPLSPRLPPGERPSMTNSLNFQLDYELDSVGPQGVHEVQLWGTKDYGRTWTQWQLDEDLQSPLDVQVDHEGVYGFRVVIVGQNGLATPAPRPGDLADVWVGVDTTKPSVRITSARYGEGLHAGELDIRWQTLDDSLGDRPVTISFSEQATGPWIAIAAAVPDSGQYYWKIDSHTPREIFLRIEVRDEGGNLGSHQLVEPLNTRGLIPQAIIRSVRPVAPASESGNQGQSRSGP